MRKAIIVLITLIAFTGVCFATVIVEDDFDSYTGGTDGITELTAIPGWAKFGFPGTNLKIEAMPGEARSDPNTLYIVRHVNSNSGIQFEWAAHDPSPTDPIVFKWYMMVGNPTSGTEEQMGLGFVLTSPASTYEDAVVGWLDTNLATLEYGVKSYNTFLAGAPLYSPDTLKYSFAGYPVFQKIELILAGEAQYFSVDDELVGVWGPALDPTYDQFSLWQYGLCNTYINAPLGLPGKYWVDDLYFGTGNDVSIFMEEDFDSHADLAALNATPGWSIFGSPGTNCRFESMPGEAFTDPNTLYILKKINANAGEQYQWSPIEPTEAAPLRFTWHLLNNHDFIAKGSVIASASSTYQDAVVSWYDPDTLSTTYGIRCYDTFQTGGDWSPEALSFDAPKYPNWNKFDLLCKGSSQEVYVNDVLVGTWGPATDPAYDMFDTWQWGRCTTYEDHNPYAEGLMWIDNVSLKTDFDIPAPSGIRKVDWASY